MTRPVTRPVRRRTTRPGAVLLALMMSAGIGTLTGAPAAADPATDSAAGTAAGTAAELDDVTSRARQVGAEVDRLAVVVEQAAEEHAAATERLNVLISEENAADDRLTGARSQHQGATGTAARRAQALYMTGGAATMLQNVLTADPAQFGTQDGLADLATDLRTVRNLVGADADRVAASGTGVGDASTAARDAQALRVERQAVEAAVETAAAAAQVALEQHMKLLDQADADVVRVAERLRAEQEAAALAAAAAAAGATALGVVAAPTEAAAEAIAAAQSVFGRPYQWGATGPQTFDCSGLTSWAYRQAGVGIPRTSGSQYAGLPKVGVPEMLPGDLVFYGTSADPATIHHVALYLGGGRILHAPQTGDVVKVSGLRLSGSSVLVGAVRPTGRAGPSA